MSVDSAIVAIRKRTKLMSVRETARLIDGYGDGLPGVYLDKFGSVGVLNLHDGEGECHLEPTSEVVQKITNASGVMSLYLWRRQKRAKDTTAAGAELVIGSPVPEAIIKEGVLSFTIRPERTPSAGLFLDTRELRELLVDSSRNHTVLNTFCFTGSLGIAALVGSAKEVVQVDVSKGILEWAKQNLKHNSEGLLGTMRFICEDARDFLKREKRRVGEGKRRYDTVIIDPPSFGSGNKSSFSLKRDLPEIVQNSLSVLNDKGRLICIVNSGEFTAANVKSLVERCSSGRFSKITEIHPPLPEFSSNERDSIAMRGVVCDGFAIGVEHRL